MKTLCLLKLTKNGDTITIDREVELKIKEGDSEALDELVNANLRFVIKILKTIKVRYAIRFD